MDIQRAIDVATAAHLGQFRKYTGEPYIVHPQAVARIVSMVTNDSEVIIAAWLHDVVEDTPVTISIIHNAFNARIAQLVSEVTNVTTHADGNRMERKRLERIHLGAACPDAKTIKLADILDNVPSLWEHDRDFAMTYCAEKRLLLPWLIDGNPILYSRVDELLKWRLEY